MLKSISKELIICRKEKDEFKMMAEQLGEKCSLMKRRIERLNSLKGKSEDDFNFGCIDDYNQIVLNQNYKKAQDSNKLLNFELNDLRIKHADAESDIRLLRDKLSKLKKRDFTSDQIIDNINEATANRKQHQEHLIKQIEKLKMKNNELEKDLKLHLDEKEDLIKSRNNFIEKCERLNENLHSLMKSDERPIDKTNSSKQAKDKFLDIDSILSENSYLKEKLKCLEEDKRFSQEMLTKYKNALDKTSLNKKHSHLFELTSLTSKKSAPKSGDNLTSYLNQDIVSTREVQSFIASNNLDNLELNETTLGNLKKLVLTLHDHLNDKTAAFNLAKTNNKLLGKRINDLEAKLREYESKEKHLRIETFKLNLEDCKLNEENDLNKDVNKNIINKLDVGKENNLINLPFNLQRLVEQELKKLKD